MNTLFENRFIKQNNVIVGVSLKLTLEEATIINSLCGAISSGVSTPRCMTDKVWLKMGGLDIPYLAFDELFIDRTFIQFSNDSLNILNEKCQDFRLRIHRTSPEVVI